MVVMVAHMPTVRHRMQGRRGKSRGGGFITLNGEILKY